MARRFCMALLPGIPHSGPLPGGEGIFRVGRSSPRAYALGYAHAAPLALIKHYTISVTNFQ